jgi:hypothetical protein
MNINGGLFKGQNGGWEKECEGTEYHQLHDYLCIIRHNENPYKKMEKSLKKGSGGGVGVNKKEGIRIEGMNMIKAHCLYLWK